MALDKRVKRNRGYNLAGHLTATTILLLIAVRGYP